PHRALAGRLGDVFRRAVTHVSCGDDAVAVRLEWKRIAIQWPAVRQLSVSEQVLSRQDVASTIGQDVLARAPVRVRPAADAEEDAVDSAGLALAGRVGDGRGRDRV